MAVGIPAANAMGQSEWTAEANCTKYLGRGVECRPDPAQSEGQRPQVPGEQQRPTPLPRGPPIGGRTLGLKPGQGNARTRGRREQSDPSHRQRPRPSRERPDQGAREEAHTGADAEAGVVDADDRPPRTGRIVGGDKTESGGEEERRARAGPESQRGQDDPTRGKRRSQRETSHQHEGEERSVSIPPTHRDESGGHLKDARPDEESTEDDSELAGAGVEPLAEKGQNRSDVVPVERVNHSSEDERDRRRPAGGRVELGQPEPRPMSP